MLQHVRYVNTASDGLLHYEIVTASLILFGLVCMQNPQCHNFIMLQVTHLSAQG